MRHHSFHLSARVAVGAALLGLSAGPLLAQNTTYTLSGVTFNDGAVASGYFTYDPSTQVFGTYDITTTEGTSDILLGAHYRPSNSTNGGSYTSGVTFAMTNGTTLVLSTNSQLAGPGQYPLRPGTVTSTTTFQYSGEASPVGGTASHKARAITAGSLLGTPAPEPSQTGAIVLGTLGLAVLAIKARRRKATDA